MRYKMPVARKFLETFILSPLPVPSGARKATPGAGVMRAAKRLAKHRAKWAGIDWPAPVITRQQRRAMDRRHAKDILQDRRARQRRAAKMGV